MHTIEKTIVFAGIMIALLFGIQSLSTAHAETERPLNGAAVDAPQENLEGSACASLIQAHTAGYTSTPGMENCVGFASVDSTTYFEGLTAEERADANVLSAADKATLYASKAGAGLADNTHSVPVPEPLPATDPSVATLLFAMPLGDEIRVRQTPVDGKIIDVVTFGDIIEITEPALSARDKIGVEGEWIAVRTAAGLDGYTAAWLYTLANDIEHPAYDPPTKETTPSPVEMMPSYGASKLFLVPKGNDIRVRTEPVTGNVIDLVEHGEVIQVVESVAEARSKIGVTGQWIEVRTLDGTAGYTAAWLYDIAYAVTPDIASLPAIAPNTETTTSRSALVSLLIRAESDRVNVRLSPVSGPVIDTVGFGDVIEVIEPFETASSKIGASGQWVKVRTGANVIGYTAAWLYSVETTLVDTTATVAETAPETSAAPVAAIAPLSAGSPDGTIVTVAAVTTGPDAADTSVAASTAVTTSATVTAADDVAPEAPVAPESPEAVAPAVDASATAASAQAIMLLTPVNNDIRVRAAPVDGAIVDVVALGEIVEMTESATNAADKIGASGEWITIRTEDGVEGYTAAWLYEVSEVVEPTNNGFAPLSESEGADTLIIGEIEPLNTPIDPINVSITELGIPDEGDVVENRTGSAIIAPSAIPALEPAEASTSPADIAPVANSIPVESAPPGDSAPVENAPVADEGGDDPEIDIFNPVMPINIDITDDTAVDSAELAINDVTLQTYTAPPYEYDLDTMLLSEGEYRLTFSVTSEDGMQVTDDLYFEVEFDEPTPLPGVTAVEEEAAANPIGVFTDASTTEPENEPIRRIVTIDGIERPFALEFSTDDGLVPAEASVPVVAVDYDNTPETLFDVITQPLVSAIPAPIYDFLIVERPRASALIILIMVLILIPQGLFTIYWMTYTWNNPEVADQYRSPREFNEPQYSFTALLPARREEAVIKDTIRAVDRINYPDHLKEILILIRDEDDDETIMAAQEAINELGKDNIRLITFTDGPRNKPNGLNKGLRQSTKDVVCIFDAEDEPHPDVYNIVNTVMISDEADVVQSGVQLMNFKSSWFSVFNVLEYFFWFRSGLHAYTRKFKVTPLGGNTVFFKREWMERIGGWDEVGLTEDADVGIRLTQLGAKIQIVYEAEHATREETPDTVDSFIKQRTRWNQGFYQIFFKGDWLKLPTMTQKIVALYILLNSILQAAMILFIPVGAYIALTQNISVPLALISYVPIYILVIQLVISLIGIREFAAAYNERLPMFFSLRMAIFYYPYQLLLSVSALRAMLRMVTRQGGWEKTSHSNLHRQEQLSGVV